MKAGPAGRTARPDLLLAGAAFFCSGVAALVYQVVWQRILALHSGVGIYSVAMIVAAFMAGLGAGSRLGGRLSTRLGAAGARRAFVALEAGIAAFGAASCTLYYDWLYPHAATLYTPAWRAGVLHFAALLPPTLLMGMSLPFLVQASVRDVPSAGRVIGRLYGVNVLGAACGAWLAPWVLVHHVGIRGAVWAAVAANLLAALLAGLMAVVADRERATPRDDALPASAPPPRAAPPNAAPPQAGAGDAARQPFELWLVLYALGGFCALSLEILWFRIMDAAAKSTAFTFGTVLALYLLGCGAGALLGAACVRRWRRPLHAFLVCQCGLLIAAALGVIALVHAPADWPVVRFYVEYWRDSDPLRLGWSSDPGRLLRVYLALPLWLYGLPTFLMGFSFPILQRAVQDDPGTSGRKVGLLQAANIGGCVAGSLVAGLALLNLAGTAGTLRLVFAAGLVFAAVGLRHYGARSLFAPLAAAILLAVAAAPGQRALWLRLHGAGGGRAYVAEDATGVAAITSPAPGRWNVWVNGVTHSALPFGGVHTLLGAIPALIHPAPRDVAIIGLGSGDTAWAAAFRQETATVTVFEICGPQLGLLRRLAASPERPDKLRRFLDDPRLRVRVADGRNALRHGAGLYDVIQMDALRPHWAYSGNLYSLEFFEAMARRLKPGGFMCTWAPTPRVQATFRAAFPYAVEARHGQILVGSLSPVAFEPAAWRARAGSTAAVRYFGAGRVNEIVAHVDRLRASASVDGPVPALNHDLFPRDEFAVP